MKGEREDCLGVVLILVTDAVGVERPGVALILAGGVQRVVVDADEEVAQVRHPLPDRLHGEPLVEVELLTHHRQVVGLEAGHVEGVDAVMGV
ncbi:hypothetical protein JS578_02890 [Dysgonomonadaceae bacterium zrk40]|nr:hypothetical protein JS578_02890 [Dysgonomonadaceae bacterium zrk40]